MHLQSASSTLQRLLTQFLLLLPTMVFSQPCNLQGTYKIGPGGQYPSLTNAIADLMSTGVGGTVTLEFKANYTDSVETFPIFIGNIPCVSAVNEVIIRPEAGAGPILLHSFSSVLTFSGVQFVTLDGRPGGNGTQSGLTLLCNGAGSAAVFTNGAYANWIRYCNLEASNSGSTSGVVSFTTTNSSLGNNNNWISDCYISGRGTSLNGIYSKGTAGKPNQFGRIENSHITGFLAKGICFEENTRHWQIINNDIYQESSVVFQFGPIHGIFVNDTLSDGFTITGNHIGGQAPACGGNPYNVVGSFIGVLMATGTDNLTIIDNNEVANIHWHNQFSLEYLAGIQVLAGKVQVGGPSGNLIGSLNRNGSIVTSSYYLTEPEISGILIGYEILPGTIDTVRVLNNRIGGIRCETDSNNYLPTTLRGIYSFQQKAGWIEVRDNHIGSPNLQNSLVSEGTTGDVIGIHLDVAYLPGNVLTFDFHNRIEGNEITNLGSYNKGIQLRGGAPELTNNHIHHFYSNYVAGSTTIPNNTGINAIELRPGSRFIGNHLHDFYTIGNFSGNNTGIGIDLSQGLEIAGNFIHHFEAVAPYTPSRGIAYNETISSYPQYDHWIYNNMIALGFDSLGNELTTPLEAYGIYGVVDSTIITHNSIFLAGTADGNSAGIRVTESGTHMSRITNNILVNKKNQGTPGSFYYDNNITLDAGVTASGTLSIDYNLCDLRASGRSNLLQDANQYYPDFVSIRNATPYDDHSILGNPSFRNAPGTNQSVDLHVNYPSPADASGIPEPSVLIDYDGEIRNLFTPVDIGADAISSTTGVSPGLGANTRLPMILAPNPAGENVFVLDSEGKLQAASVRIIATDGRLLDPRQTGSFPSLQLDLRGIPAGCYIVSATDAEGIEYRSILIRR